MTLSFLSRRELLLRTAAAPLLLLAHELIAAEEQLADPKKLKPGEFAWHPERAPDGPVVIIVSIPDQWVTVYRNGKRIAVSTCSTGRPGHATPTGTFVILQKDVHHHSSTYNNAPMPYMERVTWGGVALHAGQLPGYPASHGCVRLPKEFSRLLFTVTHIGTAVIIADRNSAAGGCAASRTADLRACRGARQGSGRQDKEKLHARSGGACRGGAGRVGHHPHRRPAHARPGQRQAGVRGQHHHPAARTSFRHACVQSDRPVGRSRQNALDDGRSRETGWPWRPAGRCRAGFRAAVCDSRSGGSTFHPPPRIG